MVSRQFRGLLVHGSKELLGKADLIDVDAFSLRGEGLEVVLHA